MKVLIDLPVIVFPSTWIVVPNARLIDVPHLWPETFAVHPAVLEDGYSVTHVETGARVTIRLSEREAIKAARKRLAPYTLDEFRLILDCLPEMCRE